MLDSYITITINPRVMNIQGKARLYCLLPEAGYGFLPFTVI